jgi:hypothetical protein
MAATFHRDAHVQLITHLVQAWAGYFAALRAQYRDPMHMRLYTLGCRCAPYGLWK